MALGVSLPRIDAEGKVTGRVPYPGDLDMPGQLYLKVKWAGRAPARIRRIDTRRAEALPGIVAVFTAKDVPVNEYGLIHFDQPVICGPGSKPGADVVRYEGDVVALVAAESEKMAARAVDLIEVDYEDLPGVYDPEEALRPGAPQVHPDYPGNLLCHYRIRRGDVEAAFREAAVIVEGIYRTPFQEHAYLQPEAGIAYIDEEGRVTVVTAGQWAHEDRHQIAHALGLPEERVRVIYAAIGGAFGGREDMSVQILLALVAWRLGRPVKIVWSREESIIGHHKRHPVVARTRWAADREGRLLAVEADVIADVGAYAYTSTKVLGNITMSICGPYEVPNVRADIRGALTNNPPTGAMRGFGAPQALFIAETQMNRLAEALGMDPVEIRLKNGWREGSRMATGGVVPEGVSLSEVIEACARAAGWRRTASGWVRPQPPPSPDPTRRYGWGFACGFKNIAYSFGFPEHCWARVELHGDAHIERAVVYHAGADVGQGAHTVMVQMAAEALGLPPEKIELRASDTASTESSGSSSASRMTFMAGNAIRGAAQRALEAWQNEERPAIGEFTYRPVRTFPFDPETGFSERPNVTYGYVAEAVLVEVDLETGQVRPVQVICADDVGRAVNPLNVRGQIEGGVVQAIGYVLTENFIVQQGRILTRHFSTYLIPGVADIPEAVESLILEHPDPLGPWGVRGMAEMPFLPLAPALIAAVHDATGIWFETFPLTPDRLYAALYPERAKPKP
ncbi:MAG: aldehyde oxidase [Thermoflexus sp.]|uniref:xanthine dehydrogenase family protein molybdopterin-binding subunit n=1 Tax=Thermoflexus sp. TaxID=1969742 RepID=UPI00333258C0